MHPSTGRIYDSPSPDLVRRAGLIPVSKKEADVLREVPAAERPEALTALRNLHPLIRRALALGGEDEHVRKARNRMKRERREKAGK